MNSPEAVGLLPLWITVGGGLFLLLWEALGKAGGRRAAAWLAAGFLLCALVALLRLFGREGQWPQFLFGGTVLWDRVTLAFSGVCLVSALMACLLSPAYLERERAVTGEYYALLLFATAGMLMLVSATEFLTFFVGLELMSLAGYALAGYFRVSERSAEASFKYFLLGAFASAFLLYGVALLYGASGSTFYYVARKAVHDPGTAVFAAAAGALLLTGFGFKVALVPFHGWAPDAYDGAPAPVAAFLSTGVKAAAFGGFARILLEVYGSPGSLNAVLAALAVLTMTVGNLGALAQSSVKRMLAYSSVAHAGYALVGLAALGRVEPAAAYHAVAFYLLAYTLMTAGAFGFLAWAAGRGEGRTAFDDLSGLGLRHPWLAGCLTVFLLSLLGVPPTAGFFGKYFLFRLAVEHGLTWLAVAGVLNTLLSAYYYLRPLVLLYMKPTPPGVEDLPRAAWSLRIALGLGVLGTLAAGFFDLRI